MTKQTALRGFLAFFIILLMMPLGHTFVILMSHNLSGLALNISAFLLGLFGIFIAITGRNLRSEAMQILAGCFGAILFWGSWVEFIFINYAHSLNVSPLMDGDVILTKPEYLIMPTSLPFAALAFIMYLFMADTYWGAILVLRKWLKTNKTSVAKTTSQSIMAFVDLILLIWWAYLILLIEYDPDLLGDRHPVTMIFATICLIAGIILFVRSFKSPTWASALRQAIVTVCVLWTFIEVTIRLKLFTEVWIYPERYYVQIILIFAAFIIALLIMKYLGHKNIKN